MLLVLRRNGVHWSESELLRRLAKMYLKLWRGSGLKTATARRYNASIANEQYARVAWYVDKVLYSLLWERATHSGESVSRMIDFAIRNYAARLLEDLLRNPMPKHPFAHRNASYWEKRHKMQRNPQPEVFITYQCRTEKNDQTELIYSQKSVIYRKTELSTGDILHLMQCAA